MASIPELLVDKSVAIKRLAGAAHLTLGVTAMFLCWPYTRDAWTFLTADSTLERGTIQGTIVFFILPFLVGVLIASIGVSMIVTGRVFGERRIKRE